jgi:hypothetical protein
MTTLPLIGMQRCGLGGVGVQPARDACVGMGGTWSHLRGLRRFCQPLGAILQTVSNPWWGRPCGLPATRSVGWNGILPNICGPPRYGVGLRDPKRRIRWHSAGGLQPIALRGRRLAHPPIFSPLLTSRPNLSCGTGDSLLWPVQCSDPARIGSFGNTDFTLSASRRLATTSPFQKPRR